MNETKLYRLEIGPIDGFRVITSPLLLALSLAKPPKPRVTPVRRCELFQRG